MRTERGKGGDDTAKRIEDVLRAHPAGMHRLNDLTLRKESERKRAPELQNESTHSPAHSMVPGLPESLAAVYARFDGGEIFHETIVLLPAHRIASERAPDGSPCFAVGEIAGDDLFVDRRGRVLRREQDTGEWLAEGSRFDRWLLGVIEAEGMLYDEDGEFRDDVFDDEGDVAAELSERMHRQVLKRDPRAPAPRWRLARALMQMGDTDRARDELEQVVEEAPGFAWAWFDLAQISEELGEHETAADEFTTAAEAVPGYEHAGFFWAHAARMAARAGDEPRRAACAARAVALDPHLARAQREGAEATLDEGDVDAARKLAELAAALAPRDLAVLDLLARLRAQSH
jgi:Tfp pilus assembly protein PilF